MFGTFRTAAAIALLLGSSSITFAQGDTTKVNLTGTWSFTVVYEGGQGSPTVRITQRNDSPAPASAGRRSSRARASCGE